MKVRNHFIGCLLLGLSAVYLQGCGDGKVSSAPAARSSDSEGELTEVVEPSASYYELLMAEEVDRSFGPTPRATTTKDNSPRIFVNLDGATVSRAQRAGGAFVMCGELGVIPKTDLSPEDFENLEFYIEEYFAGISEKIEISFTKPATQPFSTIHVGGLASDIGCNQNKLKYRAPMDRNNAHQSDTAFVFSKATSDLSDLVTQIENAGEAILGLSGPEAALNPAPSRISEDKLPGTKEIHAIARLLLELDSNKKVDITPLKPELDQLIPGGARYLDGLDEVISVTVGVGTQKNGSSAPNANSGSAASGLGSWIGSILGGGSGTSGAGAPAAGTDIISAVAVMSGHPEIAIAAQMLEPVLGSIGGGGVGNVEGGNSNSSHGSLIPDYATYIGITQMNSLPELFAYMWGHVEFVEKNYDSETQKALKAMLVVAYSQAFRSLYGADE